MTCIREAEREPIRPVVYAIGLYFFLSGLDSFRIGNIGSALKIVVLIPLLLTFFNLKNLRIRFSHPLVFQLIFWSFSVVSLFYSVMANYTFTEINRLTRNILVLFCLSMVDRYNQREVYFLQRAMWAGGWLTILLMLLFSDVSAGGRLTLLLGEATQDQNNINSFYLYTFSWHCSQFILERKKLHCIPTLFIFVLVFLSGSRGALLAFACVCFTHLCISLGRTQHKFRTVVLSVTLIVFLLKFFNLVLDHIPESVAQRFSWEFIAEYGTSGRTPVWNYLLQIYFDSGIFRMFFGHGYGTTAYVNALYDKVAHNLYLDNLISVGFIGMILQVITQGSVTWIYWKRKNYALFGAYIGLIVMCMSLSLTAFKLLWNMMLIAIVIHYNSSDSLDVK